MSDEPLDDFQSELPADVPPAGSSQPPAGPAAPEPGPTAQEPLPPAGRVPPPPRAPAAPGVMTSNENDRLMGALSWASMAILFLPVLPVILLLVENNKNQPFQRYHAGTGVVFWVAAAIFDFVAFIVYLVLGAITLGCGYACLWPIFFVPNAIALYYAYEAYLGREPVIPFITEFVRQQRWA